jgi:hypothetical protein
LVFTVNSEKIKIGNDLKDESCEILNEILLENKSIEKIDFSCKLFKIIKDNTITSNGLIFLTESLIKNIFLKEIRFLGKLST